MGKDKLSSSTRRSHDKNRDNNNDDTRAGPVNADLVDNIQVTRAKGIDQSAHEHNSPEAQDGLPLVGDKVLVEDADGAENKLRAREVN